MKREEKEDELEYWQGYNNDSPGELFVRLTYILAGILSVVFNICRYF